ncbi:MAG: tetratricopeptide repeat protein [Bacteroidia bacterium]
MVSKKKSSKQNEQHEESHINSQPTNTSTNNTYSHLFYSFKIQALLLIVLGIIIYSNSFYNEYALDDGIVIEKNEYVQQGFRGIPKILSTDAYDSFYKQMNAKQQLSGGRYRPLSIVTFAIEQQVFGNTYSKKITDNTVDAEIQKTALKLALIRHIINVLLYILSVIILLYFLRQFIFSEYSIAAFFTALLFLIHPIHTEVVANIKSRDEILSFLFIILTLITALKYVQSKQSKYLAYALSSYFLALLSKEYAVTLLVLIPMLIYIVNKKTLQQSIISTLPYIAIAVIYLYIRFNIVGKGSDIENPDVLNSPFKFATNSEKWATKIEILNRYLKLLFYPNPLSSDYSYNTIPYASFGNINVWSSIIISCSILVSTVILFFKRNILSFALAFYALHLLLVSNLIMDLGATMGERLIYHSSLGFVIVIGTLITYFINKNTAQKWRPISIVLLLSVVTCWSSVKTITRNAQWKNDTSLFIADAATVPNSALVNGNAGKAYIDLSEKPENKAQEVELLKKAIYHLNRSVSIHKEYVNGYLNIGVAYFKLKEYDKALAYWQTAKRIYPNNPFLKRNIKLLSTVYYNNAMSVGKTKPEEAIKWLEKAVETDAENADYWYNLGGASYTVGDFEKAKKAWTKTLQLNPNHLEAQRGMAALPIGKN